jgi:hypothetical protein
MGFVAGAATGNPKRCQQREHENAESDPRRRPQWFSSIDFFLCLHSYLLPIKATDEAYHSK